jgi:hypothetical protein
MQKITIDFNLSGWFHVDVGSSVGYSRRTELGNVPHVSDVQPAPIFRVDPDDGGSMHL